MADSQQNKKYQAWTVIVRIYANGTILGILPSTFSQHFVERYFAVWKDNNYRRLTKGKKESTSSVNVSSYYQQLYEKSAEGVVITR